MPSSTSTSASRRKDPANAQTQAHARALRGHLEALDELRESRAQLVQRARRLADADDIQPRIMREAAAMERWTEIEPAMFENTLDQEMNKYEKFKDGVEESADKQIELTDLIKVLLYSLRSPTVMFLPLLSSVLSRAVYTIASRRPFDQGAGACSSIS